MVWCESENLGQEIVLPVGAMIGLANHVALFVTSPGNTMTGNSQLRQFSLVFLAAFFGMTTTFATYCSAAPQQKPGKQLMLEAKPDTSEEMNGISQPEAQKFARQFEEAVNDGDFQTAARPVSYTHLTLPTNREV